MNGTFPGVLISIVMGCYVAATSKHMGIQPGCPGLLYWNLCREHLNQLGTAGLRRFKFVKSGSP